MGVTLLHNMREFVCKEAPSSVGLGIKSAPAKEDVSILRESVRVQRLAALCGPRTRVNLHTAKVTPEEGLKSCPQGRPKTLSLNSRTGQQSLVSIPSRHQIAARL